ncbi:MAG: hypothetical protein M1828_001925 [Chrysothrix sp. TS-e1954]|nr:MAG: hypothetical protein M1828_001925 [Chrysothrix sp. TS-e1954]
MRWRRNQSGSLGLLFALSSGIRAITYQSAPAANLDLSQLGQVAFAGSFDSISLYDYVGQDEDGLNTNGSQSLLGRFPNGAFADLQAADANIASMCPFLSRDGTFNGIIVAGNFTSLGGLEAQAAALYDPSSNSVTGLPGLTGTVSALYCDQESSSVYFGGAFTGENSSNAISWVTGWSNLPFDGFNGPVSAISKLPNGNIVFGGSFTGTGNVTKPKTPDAQVVNFGSGNITAGPNTTRNGFEDPKNIICATSGNGWLLQDHSPGFWQSNFDFGAIPTKLQLLQTQEADYGTKTFRFTAFPSNGIMNLTYYDDDGEQTCYPDCPLLSNNKTYQDFYFVNPIGMNGFRIDISDWYGKGAGLSGIELFQNDIYAYGINAFNEPKCDDVSTGSSSKVSPGWNESQSGLPTSRYLTATLPNGTIPSLNETNLSVVFSPDIKQSGNYTVLVYTPGCLADDTCSNRGEVKVTGTMSTGSTESSPPISTTLFQSNNYDKFDQVYYGYVDSSSSGFKPTVTLTPTLGQNGPLTVVAQRVRWQLVGSSGGLNGLFEYNSSSAVVDTNYAASSVNRAGISLDKNAEITSLQVINGVTYAAGNFSSGSYHNIMSIGTGNATSLASGGLNAGVQTMYADGNTLYAGGNFSNTQNQDEPGLSNVAAYDTTQNKWQALGAGVDGMVSAIVPLQVNISETEQVPAIAVSGTFSQIRQFGSSGVIAVDNVAVWIPSHSNWLQNVGTSKMSLSGRLVAQTNVPDSDPLYAGSVDSQILSASGATSLTSAGGYNLDTLPANIQTMSTKSNSLPLRKRAQTLAEPDGVVTGMYYNDNGMNITILGGSFTAKATNGSTLANLVLVNGTSSNTVTGLLANTTTESDTITTVETQGTSLFAGGNIPNGFIAYDLVAAAPSASQPPPLNGPSVAAMAIAARPSSSTVYFGGSFQSAGSLSCPALCIYDTGVQQWTNPAPGLSADSIVTVMQWTSPQHLIIAGDLTVSGKKSNLASYDAKAATFSTFAGADSLAGPITAFTATDDTYTSFFVAGHSFTSNSDYISKFTSSSTTLSSSPTIAGTWATALSPDTLGPASKILNLQILSLTTSHASTPLLADDKSLLITGLLQLSNFGNASAALYNGTALTPFILSTLSDGSPGKIYKAFVSRPQNLLASTSSSRLALGFIVLIALAISLALIFLLVVAGIAAERIRRRREGYVRAPTSAPSYEKYGGAGGNVGGIRAGQLFGGVGAGGNGSGNGNGG